MVTSSPRVMRPSHDERRRPGHTRQRDTPMPLSAPSLRPFVRRALVDATGTAQPDPPQLASAFDRLCRRLCERLQPVFGNAAVGALFARSVHVATLAFPWLDAVVPKNQDFCSVEGIASLDGLDASTLEEGLSEVLAFNIALLTTFVGEDVVVPLVQQAWGVVGAPGTEGDQ
jgi:hypothetical protein